MIGNEDFTQRKGVAQVETPSLYYPFLRFCDSSLAVRQRHFSERDATKSIVNCAIDY